MTLSASSREIEGGRGDTPKRLSMASPACIELGSRLLLVYRARLLWRAYEYKAHHLVRVDPTYNMFTDGFRINSIPK